MERFSFSYTGLIFLLILITPNIVWARTREKEIPASIQENKLLVFLEKAGQVSLVFSSLFSFSYKISEETYTILFILLASFFLILYIVWWYIYFKSDRTLNDLYQSLFFIPFAGASLPVISFVFLALYESNTFLLLSTILFGIGHIGIFYNHSKNL